MNRSPEELIKYYKGLLEIKFASPELSMNYDERKIKIIEEMLISMIEKSDMYDKYYEQLKASLYLISDVKTVEEFLVKNKLPEVILTLNKKETNKVSMDCFDVLTKIEDLFKKLNNEQQVNLIKILLDNFKK